MTGAGSASGCYRRSIALVAGPGEVRGELEDDFHHFRVVLAHDGERIIAIEGEAVRFPWSTCPMAAGVLALAVGMPLSPRSTAIGDHLRARDNCTHLFDLAGLAVAHAGAGRRRRRYDVAVPDRVGVRTRATLHRDGELLLAWDLDGETIGGPAPLGGRTLRGGFLAWAERNLEDDVAEAAIVLRRACAIAWGRLMDLDEHESAAAISASRGTCFTFQPERMPVALRMKGSTRDFSELPSALLEEPGAARR